jgi:hypothetical protein
VIAVEQLMAHGKAGWDEDNLRALFDDETVLPIKNIPRWDIEQEDSWVWLKISFGEFTVKLAYKVCNQLELVHQDC